jgi:hypothetical protein
VNDFSQEQEEILRFAEDKARRDSENVDPEDFWANINYAAEHVKQAKMILLYATPAKRIQLLDYADDGQISSFQRIDWMRSDLNKIDRLNDDEAKRLRKHRDGVTG